VKNLSGGYPQVDASANGLTPLGPYAGLAPDLDMRSYSSQRSIDAVLDL
jgi:hypothetical protein